MINGKRIAVVLPAYNAEKTLEATYAEIPLDIVDEVILVDDASSDKTVEIARRIGIRHVVKHDKNRGYGGNQKTCYRKALELGADIVVMLHPDYQYTPRLISAMANIIAFDVYANRILTLVQNLLMRQKLSEYHTGYRAFSREVLAKINYVVNSNDFVFDNQMLSQIFFAGFQIGEITCPTKYFEEASSINFQRSLRYGLGVLKVSAGYALQKMGLIKLAMYSPRGNG